MTSKLAKILLKRVILATGITIVVIPMLLYCLQLLSRPPRTNKQEQLFQGVVYRRQVRSTPRNLMLHIVAIDLKAPGIKLLLTPGKQVSDLKGSNAQITSEFLKKYNLQLAINASYFHPFYEHHPWDYYPRRGDRVKVLGQAISNGNSYSPAAPGWPILCISEQQRAQIVQDTCPRGTLQAVAGAQILVEHGKSIIKEDSVKPKELHPRTAVAIDEKGEKLWLILVDGRQPFYSEGVTLAELKNIAMELGADSVLNLDGGGSTTLVMAGCCGLHLLNSPIHTKIPMRQRPVANHLGIYALPKN
ncbi:MAG: phosphodiester glycosidase family protein [Potamolinea sp.]